MRSTCLASVAALSVICAACGGSDSSGAPSSGGADGGALADGASGDGSSPSDGGSGGDASSSDASSLGDGALPPPGNPITAPNATWTWVDFPDSACDDGSPTGVGVYLTSASKDVIVYLTGGGACWDYNTCVTLSTTTHGPFGSAQFQTVVSGVGGTVLDGSAAANPFKDWNKVFVPYCTGDLHAGDAVTTYTGGDGGSATFHHKGHANVVAYARRIAATFNGGGRVAIAGSSAGGGGALFNYPVFRGYFPNHGMFLIDDSLPLFEGSAIPQILRDAFYKSWNIGETLDPLCGAACKGDLSLAMKAVAADYPNDRMALLSSEQDQTIRTFYAMSGATYQQALTQLTTDVLDPTGHFRHFYVSGQTHTMLGNPGNFSVGGSSLQSWLGQMVSGDSQWTSLGP